LQWSHQIAPCATRQYSSHDSALQAMSTPHARLTMLGAQLAAGPAASGLALSPPEVQQLSRAPTSGAVKGLPRFDPYIMETYLDDLRDLKRQVTSLLHRLGLPCLMPRTCGQVAATRSRSKRGSCSSGSKARVTGQYIHLHAPLNDMPAHAGV
jgi:hypothetical protein